MSARIPIEQRFWRHVAKGSERECWLWKGSLDGHGYGQLGRGGSGAGHVAAHRLSYEMHIGPIPAGLDIDHLCRNPRCVNPAHLEPVTRGENTRRGIAQERRREMFRNREFCNRGHRWSEHGHVDASGKRRCRECERTDWFRTNAKRRAKTVRRPPAPWHQVSLHFGVSRVTAWRWLRGYKESAR